MCVVFAIANLTEKKFGNIIIQNVTDLGLTSKSIETLPSIKIKVPMGLCVSILGKPAMSRCCVKNKGLHFSSGNAI